MRHGTHRTVARKRTVSCGASGQAAAQVVLAAVLMLTAACPAGAADADAPRPDRAPAEAPRDGARSETLIVTATRGRTDAFIVPYTTDVVQLDLFAGDRMYRTTTEAMADVPAVMVQKTSHGQGSPYIRGFTGFRTLMMQDGVRLNNSVFRDGPNQYWNMIDPYVIKRLEIVKGPSSVLYGSDAIGGTVNAITRGRESFDGRFDWHRQIFGRGSTAEAGVMLRGEVSAQYDGALGILAGGTARDFGNLDGGKFVGRQDRTNYHECAGDVKMVYRFGEGRSVTLAHYTVYQDDAWRQHRTIFGSSWHGTTVGNELKRVLDQNHSLTYVKYRHAADGLPADIDVTFSFQEMGEIRERVRNNLRRDRQGFNVETYGLTAQASMDSSSGKWTWGVEYYRDQVDSFQERWTAAGVYQGRRIQGPVGDDASYDLLGLFVQDQIPLGESVEVTLGGRYTYARAAADKVQDPNTGNRVSITEDWDTVVGSARASWFVDEAERVNVFGGVSQGFRAPNLSDLTRLDTARTNEIETPSPGLDPERFISYEVGVKARAERVRAGASYFFTDVYDMIVRTPTGNVIGVNNEVTKRNAGRGNIQGVELRGECRLDGQWTAFGTVAWMYGEVDTYPTAAPVKRSEPIDRLMPPTGEVGLRWTGENKRLWAETSCTMAAKADKLSTRDQADTDRIPPGGTPGHAVFNLRGGWKVTDGLDIRAGVENVGNIDYRIHGSGVNQPGINLRLAVRWRF